MTSATGAESRRAQSRKLLRGRSGQQVVLTNEVCAVGFTLYTFTLERRSDSLLGHFLPWIRRGVLSLRLPKTGVRTLWLWFAARTDRRIAVLRSAGFAGWPGPTVAGARGGGWPRPDDAGRGGRPD